MTTRNILFLSGSVGLGHVTRDLAIAAARQRFDLIVADEGAGA